MGLVVAVTGPTGELGISTVDALEQEPGIDRIIGMARRSFDPGSHGWAKTSYQQGDILDRGAVDALVYDADVVVHLAFIVLGSRAEGERVNVAGTRNVFEATVAAKRPRRLVYTSSVAAYGYHSDNGSTLEVFVLRPCIVAGPKPTALADAMPWNQLPAVLRSATTAVPLFRPPFPDPGTPMQLVHHDDVAAAIALATSTSAPAGAYNIAGDGLPFLPAAVEWLHAGRTSAVMDTSKAKRMLGWAPRYTSAETLRSLASDDQ